MATYARQFGPHAPDATYVAHEYDEQLFDTGEVEINYVTAGDASRPALLLIPGQTESWWGYEQALRSAGRALPGLRRRPPRPGTIVADARSLHARPHRQRPGPVHRRRHRPADDRRRPLVGRRDLGLALGLRQARARSSAPTTRTRRCSPPRCAPRSARASASRSARSSRSWPSTSATSGRSATGTGWSPRCPTELPGWMAMLAGAFGMGGDGPPQALKEYDPEWGRAFWTGIVLRLVRPRAHAPVGEGPGAVHPPLPHDRRGDRRADGRQLRPAGRTGPPARHRRRATVRVRQPADHAALAARRRPAALRRHAASAWADTLPNGAAS